MSTLSILTMGVGLMMLIFSGLFLVLGVVTLVFGEFHGRAPAFIELPIAGFLIFGGYRTVYLGWSTALSVFDQYKNRHQKL